MRFKMRRNFKPGRNISEGKVDSLLYTTANRHGCEFCLDIGAGQDKHPDFQTLDIIADFEPDYIGDMRCLFATGYMERVDEYPSLETIPNNHFEVIKLQHTVEHVEWIYQDFMFRWIMDILAPGGLVYIGTPNLEYAVGVYVANRQKQLSKQEVKYPMDEHVYLKPGIPSDMQWWVNFKLFSGCSPGDYHHCMYDRYSLYAQFEKIGFDKISIFDDSVLKAIAYKPAMAQNHDVNEAVRRAVE